MRPIVRICLEFAVVFVVFVLAFMFYLMRAEPTKFIYYNF